MREAGAILLTVLRADVSAQELEFVLVVSNQSHLKKLQEHFGDAFSISSVLLLFNIKISWW